MVRMNITVPDEIAKELKRVKNKSQFIAQTLRDKFISEKKKEMNKTLVEAYKKSAQEDRNLARDWDSMVGDGIE